MVGKHSICKERQPFGVFSCHAGGVDLTQPLSTLSPSLEGDVLTVLAHTEAPLSGRQIATLARRGSHTSVTSVLERLVDHGLAEVQRAGRAHLYRLNREHLLAPVVLQAVAASGELRRRLGQALRGWAIPCLHASLYGSVPRGDSRADSDIDLLLIRPETLTESEMDSWDDQVRGLELDAFRWTGNTLSCMDLTVQDLARGLEANEPIFDSWREDGVLLIGSSLHSLLRGLPKAG